MVFENDFTRLNFNSQKNDLKEYFQKNNISKGNVLTGQYNKFMEGEAEDHEIYLNLYCPFWNSHNVEGFLVFSLLVNNQPNVDFEILQNSLNAYNSFFDANKTTTKGMDLVNDYLQNSSNPSTTVVQTKTLNKKSSLHVNTFFKINV